MIREKDKEAVSSILAEQAEQFGCLADRSATNKSLYWYLKGLEDSLWTAVAIIDSKREVNNDNEYKSLYALVDGFTRFRYGNRNEPDEIYLKSFGKGRMLGSEIAADFLEVLVPEALAIEARVGT